jgi:LysM repeat protein
VDKYVSGLKHTAEDNEKLKARILAGEFDKLKVQANNKPTVQSTRKLITVPELRTEPNRTYYTVQQGDNLSSIAKKNNLTLQQLLKLNSQYKSNPNKIQIGDQVIISSDETADVKRRNIKHLREQEASYKTNLDVILAARHNSNFGVVDKDKQTITVYDKNKNIIARVPINTGASNLDYNTRTYTQGDSRNGKLISHLGNESTPAGITEITSVSTYHGVPAFQRSRVGNDNKVSKVFDKTTGQ